MKFNFPVNNFSSGEWSPKMRARTDVEQYSRSCEELTNMIVQMQGGATYRGGTVHTDITNLAARNRFFDSKPYGIQDSGKLVPYLPLDSTKQNLLYISPDTNASDGHGSNWYNFPSGTRPGIIGTTSVSGWVPQDTWYTQIGDLLILTNKSGTFKPKVYFYDAAWVTPSHNVKDIDREYVTSKPWNTIPFGPVQALDTSVTMTPSLATVGTGRTLTASAAYFTSGMVGAYFKYCDGTTAAGYARITAFTSTTVVTIQILSAFAGTAAVGGSGNADSFWQISAWHDDAGWPRTCVAHQGRLIFGGTRTLPDTIWGSQISDIFMFNEVPSPDTTGPFGFANGAYLEQNGRPFTLTPNSAEASNILALSSAKTLVMNTDRSEIVAYGTQGAMGPNDVVFESSTSFGAEAIQPARVNNYLTFVQKNGRKVRDVIFNFTEDQYKSNDLAFVADHLFLSAFSTTGVDRIMELSKTEGASSLLWVLSNTGKLYVLTLDRDYQVNAWSRIVLGIEPSSTEDARILTCCSFPSTGDGPFEKDALHMVVIRTVNGNSVLSYEVMRPPWELNNPANIDSNTLTTGFVPVYLDCAKVKHNNPPSPGGSLGATYVDAVVSVVADGAYLGEFTVSSLGNLSIPVAATDIVVGYKYDGIIKTSPIEQGGQAGVPMGRHKKIDELIIRFWNTGSGKFGRDITEMDEIPVRSVDQPMNEPPNYFTGDQVVPFPPAYDRQLQVIIQQDKPYPMNVLAIIPRGVTYD
jgi:hypothetical protein